MTVAAQPLSTTVVALASAMIAGPVTVPDRPRCSRWYSGTCRHCPPVYIGTVPSSGPVPPSCSASRGRSGWTVTPTASTLTASATSGRSIRNENSRRWLDSNAERIVPRSVSGTGTAVSVPSYRRCTIRRTSIRSSGTPSSRSSVRAAPSISPATSVSRSIAAGSSRCSTDCSRVAIVSASPIPSADSTPAIGGTSTVRMPSESATAQACCAPAPPNVVSAYRETSWPFWIEIFRTALAMFATAIRR